MGTFQKNWEFQIFRKTFKFSENFKIFKKLQLQTSNFFEKKIRFTFKFFQKIPTLSKKLSFVRVELKYNNKKKKITSRRKESGRSTS